MRIVCLQQQVQLEVHHAVECSQQAASGQHCMIFMFEQVELIRICNNFCCLQVKSAVPVESGSKELLQAARLRPTAAAYPTPAGQDSVLASLAVALHHTLAS